MFSTANERPPVLSMIVSMLPVLMSTMAVIGGSILCAVSIIPNWRTFEATTDELEAGRIAVDEQATRLAIQFADDLQVLEQQIANAEAARSDSADTLWTELQVDAVLDRLYQYANESVVTLTVLQREQAQQRVPVTDVFSLRTFQIQVDGTVPKLMNFVSRLREDAVGSFTVTSFNLSQRDESAVLRMSFLMYTSPFASGDVFSLLPNLSTPTPIPPTLTPSLTPTATLTPMPTPTPTVTLIPTTTPTPLPPTSTPTASPTIDPCPGAPASLFTGGEIAVVNLPGISTLRMLQRPRTDNGSIRIVGYARNGDLLQLVDGPICGMWEGQRLWYWYASFDGIQGWVGEGTTSNRWLCPVDSPTCLN